MLDSKSKLGITFCSNLINNRLRENISNIGNIYILDANNYFIGAQNINNNKMWYASKVPYSLEIFKKLTQDLYSCFRALKGESRRLIVVDLDNTIWGGVLGDVGWDSIQLGGHDYLGEAFSDFQKALKSLKNRGVLLAIASKNYEEIALNAINKNPEEFYKFLSEIKLEDRSKKINAICNHTKLSDSLNKIVKEKLIM